MTTFVFTYRMPKGYTPGRPDTMATWNDWFERMGDRLINRGNPVFQATTLGNCGADTVLGGYSLVTADDLDTAAALARDCPALDDGCGVEVGVITEFNRDDPRIA